MMDVETVEEAQAVLLDGMAATEYITIQRTDGENMSKGVSLLTLNGELISEGMVVDMINAGVAGEYNSATQYYETEDLLPHELTEVSSFPYCHKKKKKQFSIDFCTFKGGSKIGRCSGGCATASTSAKTAATATTHDASA